MKIVIYSSYPCYVKIENKTLEITQNEHIECDLNESDIIVKPLKNYGEPFIIDIENPSPRYRIIKRDDKILIFILDGFLVENILCQSFEHGSIKSSIEAGSKQIIFSGNSHKKVIHFSSPIEEIKIGAFLFINYATFKSENESKLIAYNPKKNTAKTFSAESIELNNDGFTLIKRDFAYNKIKLDYYVDSEGLKLKNKDFDASILSSPNETIPYKFMNSIKLQDYQSALSYFSNSLSQKLNENALKEYFGEITYFYMLDPLSCFAISNGNNLIFDFTLSSDKISDIQQT